MNKQDFLTHFLLQQPQHNSVSPVFSSVATKALKQAAVCLLLVQRDAGLSLIFTLRALHLRHHPGQVSFPGGKFELSDASLAFTALRETEEEIGIKKEQIKLQGSLPALITTSGYHVTPFIGFVDSKHQLIINNEEVKNSFEVPFSFVLNPNNFYKQHLIANKNRHFTYCCGYKNHLIWGATAQMLINLQQHLNVLPRHYL